MKKTRLGRVASVVLAIVGLLAAYSYFADRSTPTGQAPLAEVNDQVFEEFRNEFNRARDRVRVIALLSPT